MWRWMPLMWGKKPSCPSVLPQKLHPCAFFCRCLSPTERNYDIGKRGVLKSGGTDWMELRNHFWSRRTTRTWEYVRCAKRLNSGQARWALFFT